MIKQPLRSFWTLGLLAATACLHMGCSELRRTVVVKTEAHSTPFSASMALSADTGNGTISIEQSSELVLAVDATIRAKTAERLEATRLVVNESADGTYEVFIEWPDDQRLSGEGASLNIRLPGASDIQLVTSNGNISVEGLDAAILASTTNGTVTIIGPAREANVTTTNGSIRLEQIVGSVRARSTNGRIDASLDTDNPGPVNLTSTNGSITLRVGASFAGSVSVRTSNGQISLGDFQPDRAPSTLKQDRRTGQFDFGGEGGESSLQTTNGNVTIAPIEP